MKRINFIAATFAFVLMSALPLFAQTVGATKTCFINTGAFSDDKQGISKVVSALTALDKEFEPRQKELDDMGAKLESIAKDIQNLQTQLNNAATAKPPVVNVDKLQSDIAAKNDEGTRLQIDIKRRQEDAKAAYEKRRDILLAPIQKDIFNAINEYAKAKGFDLILDGGALSQGLVYVSQSLDMTEDFIKYFNAKTGNTATTSTPATKPAGTAAKP
jgi:outer membrane protein